MRRLCIIGCLLLANASNGWAENPFCHDVIDHGESTGYRVVSYDAATKTWTILRNGTFDGKYMVKRIIVACQGHKYADGETLRGRDYCSLQVGRLYHWYKKCDNGEAEMVSETPGISVLTITEGDRPNQDNQFFDILRYEVLPDT